MRDCAVTGVLIKKLKIMHQVAASSVFATKPLVRDPSSVINTGRCFMKIHHDLSTRRRRIMYTLWLWCRIRFRSVQVCYLRLPLIKIRLGTLSGCARTNLRHAIHQWRTKFSGNCVSENERLVAFRQNYMGSVRQDLRIAHLILRRAIFLQHGYLDCGIN